MKVVTRNRYRIGLFSVTLLFTNFTEAYNLVSVYQQAAQDAPQLERAREALAAVEEKKTQANAALFLPEANATASVNRDAQNVRLFGAEATGDSGRSNFMFGGYSLTLTQPILHYDRIMVWQQTDIRIAQAETQFAVTEIDLLLQVTERYFGVLAAANNVKFAKAQQESLARGLKEVKQRQAVGFLAMTDVQEAQAGFDQAVADTIEAENMLQDAKEALQEVAGNHYDTLADLQDDIPLIPPDPANEERWVNQAMMQNLGLMTSEQTVEIAKVDIDIQKAGHLPTLDTTVSHSFSTSGGRFGAADIEDTVVGMALNVPLYQGGRVSSKTREAEHRYREADAKFKQEQRAVHRSASKAFLGVVASISQVKALQQSLNSSQTGLAATQASFRVGRRTALDVIVAEREWLRAQKNFARARYDYVLNTLRLKQSVGTLSQDDLAKVNQWLKAKPLD